MPSELIRKAKVPTLARADAADTSLACDQCGDSLAGLRVVRRPVGASMRAFCCNGCAFIAEQLFLAQAGSRDRALLNASIAAEAEATSAAIERNRRGLASSAVDPWHGVQRVRADDRTKPALCAGRFQGECRLRDPHGVCRVRSEAGHAR